MSMSVFHVSLHGVTLIWLSGACSEKLLLLKHKKTNVVSTNVHSSRRQGEDSNVPEVALESILLQENGYNLEAFSVGWKQRR